MATTFATLIRQARNTLDEIYALVPPGSPLVSNFGTPGATTYTYVVIAVNALGHSEGSFDGTTLTGNAVLSGTNLNVIQWVVVPGAVSYSIYRTVGGATQGLIESGNTSNVSNDTGLAGDSTTPPTVNTSGVTNAFWTDNELFDVAVDGVKDLWGAIIDLHAAHFQTIDITTMSLAANGLRVSGVPSDVYRIRLIEPRDTTVDGSNPDVIFVPRAYHSREFIAARSLSPADPFGTQVIYYELTGAGSPVAAPAIECAPKLSSTLLLRVVYIPTLASSTYTTSTSHPIPGEADKALKAYIIAFARAKERDDRSPDPNWIAIYSTEKQALLTRLTPRQEQEPEVVEGLFEGYPG